MAKTRGRVVCFGSFRARELGKAVTRSDVSVRHKGQMHKVESFECVRLLSVITLSTRFFVLRDGIYSNEECDNPEWSFSIFSHAFDLGRVNFNDES